VAEVSLEQESNVSYPEIVTDYLYRGSWAPSSMPNQDMLYEISISATNSLGNTIEAAAGQLEIVRASYSGIVIIATNSRLRSSLSADISQYVDALRNDGYLGVAIALDSPDVSQCGANPATGPVVEGTEAAAILPQCIAYLERTNQALMLPGSYAYVLILGGHEQVRQFDGGPNGIRGNYYTDDYYADLNGDSRPDRPIGRLPDGVPPEGDSVRTALRTAARLHQEHGWIAGGSHYAWTLDVPRGWGSPTNEHIECIVKAMGGSDTCGSDTSCYFAPPFSGGPLPPGWTAPTDMLYVCGHGMDQGAQFFTDHEPSNLVMGTSQTLAQRDFTNTIHFYNPCWGGRINNVDESGSSVIQSLRKGAVAVFGGTSPQAYDPTATACAGLPMTRGLFAGSTYLTNLAYEINQNSPRAIGDGWLKAHNTITNKIQREQNVMYGDPSIRVK
jgi:hypothetical protein